MKIFFRIVSVLEILLGIFFLCNVVSDIQLGFGALLVADGVRWIGVTFSSNF